MSKILRHNILLAALLCLLQWDHHCFHYHCVSAQEETSGAGIGTGHGRGPQPSFFEWLFGPTVKASVSDSSTSSSIQPLIYHQLNRKNPSDMDVTSNKPFIGQTSEIQRAAILSYNDTAVISPPPDNNVVVPGRRIIKLKPKPRTNQGEDSGGQAETQSIPQQKSTERKVISSLQKRVKRESLLNDEKHGRFRQLVIPYVKDESEGDSVSLNHDIREEEDGSGIKSLRKRQLFLSPGEQQMLAIRQQQDLATASMLQTQRLLNRFNRYVDDYYDDDDDDYDSRSNEFNRYFPGRPPPYLQPGVVGQPQIFMPIPPQFSPLGRRRRRNVAPGDTDKPHYFENDELELGDNNRGFLNTKRKDWDDNRREKEKAVMKNGADSNIDVDIRSTRSNTPLLQPHLGPISKTGWWSTIEDYDLSSDFNKHQHQQQDEEENENERESLEGGFRSSVAHHTNAVELDEEEEEDEMRQPEVKAKQDFPHGQNGRSHLGRQQEENMNTSSSTSPSTASTGASTVTILIPIEDEDTTTVPTFTSSSSESSTTDSGEAVATTTPSAVVVTTSQGGGELETTTTNVGSTDSVEESTPSSEEVTPTQSSPSVDPTTVSITSSSTTTTPKPNVSPPPYRPTLNCRCGMQSVRGFHDGDRTVIRSMVNPWLVAVGTRRKHLCAGSIINNKYVLTSKKCVKKVKKNLIVTAGMGSGVPRNFSVVHVNPHKSRDIALLRIKPAMAPNAAMRPICLPIGPRSDTEDNQTNPDTGVLVTFKQSVARRGKRRRHETLLQLVHSEIPMLRGSKCGGQKDNGNGLCPGPPGSMTCGGDSGGILQVYQRGYSYEQIGVVSTTVGCRASRTPGVYTDVRKSVKWILYNTRDAQYCKKPKVSAQDLLQSRNKGGENESKSNLKEREEDVDGDEDIVEELHSSSEDRQDDEEEQGESDWDNDWNAN